MTFLQRTCVCGAQTILVTHAGPTLLPRGAEIVPYNHGIPPIC